MKKRQFLAIGLAFVTGCAAHEPPRALSERELANITAFANALGYVRFFHPTDAAANVNWDAFAVRAIRTVEGATSDDNLAAMLTSVFAPITSNVRFAKTGNPLPTTIPKPADATAVVYWRHLGLGSPDGSTCCPHGQYRSVRVVAEINEIGRPVALSPNDSPTVSLPPVPDPSRPMIAALGGGVSMSMPIALFTHKGVSDSLPNPSFVMERFSADDRATRLADVALAWSLFKHFYPYFDVVQTDWPAALDAALRSAATDADDVAFQATLERLLAALHDGHAFIRPAVYRIRRDVHFAWAEGHLIVAAVGDSARARGLAMGDEVVDIDGRPTESVLADRSARISGATPQWIRSLSVRELLASNGCRDRCDRGTLVQFRVQTASGAARDVSIPRWPMYIALIKTDSIREVSPGVLYINLARVLDADLDSVMARAQRAKAVIVDIRGGISWQVASTFFAHLSDSLVYGPHFMIPVITLPNYERVGFIDHMWTVAPTAPRLKSRLIFLSDGGSISSAELFLEMVEANRLGDIVGERSAGTNGNMNELTLPGDYTLGWTGQLVLKRDGGRHHGVGIAPTIPASPTVAGIRAGRDDVLERAIALATGQRS